MSLKHSIQLFSPNKDYLYNRLLKNIYEHQGNILYSNINKSKYNMYAANIQLNLPINVKVLNILDENKLSEIKLKKEFQMIKFTNNKYFSNESDKMILHINSADTPGIIHNVVSDLSKLNIDIDNINSFVTPAPMSGIELFNLRIKLSLPENNHLININSILENYDYEKDLIYKKN